VSGRLKSFQRNWSSIVTLICLVAVATIEALQQALSQSPAVLSRFPWLSLGGGWHYVPLGLLIVSGVVWLIGRHRKNQDAQLHSTSGVTKQVVASANETVSDAEIRDSISIFKESMDAWLEVLPGRLYGFIHVHNCSSKPIEAVRFENLEVQLNGFKSLYTNYTLTLKNALAQPRGTVTSPITIDLDSDRTALIQDALPPHSLQLSGNLVLRCAGREVSKVTGIAFYMEVHKKEA